MNERNRQTIFSAVVIAITLLVLAIVRYLY
jgi:cbb3-type cytochrome oxidase subunit 3